MSRRYIFPAIFLFVPIIFVSFFWIVEAKATGDGACCTMPGVNDSCQASTSEFYCESTLNGDWLGSGSTCSDCAIGACCRTEDPYIGECSSNRRLDQCDAIPGQWLGSATTCSPNPCKVPDHEMCYLMHDPLNKVADVKIEIPQLGVDMTCEDTGATRMYCAPACKTIIGAPTPSPAPNPAETCISVSNLSDFLCYRYDQCAGNLVDLPDGVMVSDQFGERVIDDLNEHVLCVPAEMIIPTPPPTPSGTPSPEPTITCSRPPGSLGPGCNDGPGDVCTGNKSIYACDGTGGGLPTTACVAKLNSSRCCVADTSSVGSECFVEYP